VLPPQRSLKVERISLYVFVVVDVVGVDDVVVAVFVVSEIITLASSNSNKTDGGPDCKKWFRVKILDTKKESTSPRHRQDPKVQGTAD
jgi:hypothetical protein